MAEQIHNFLHKLAVCHILLLLAFILVITRKEKLAGTLCLCIGLGGVGAAWSRWSEDNGGWLDLSAALKAWPRASVARCFAEHGVFIPIGLWLLRSKKWQ